MNEKVNETEQWKLSGNCNKCRRKQFCTKQCGAQKRHNAVVLHNLKERMLDAMLPGMRHYL